MSFSPEYFNALVKARRSVFPDQFEHGKRVPDEIIRQIVENATWAPNHGQMEPWNFTVFTGDGLKTLAGFQSELYKKDAGADFNEGKYVKLQQQPLKASHVISIGMKRTTTKRIPETEDIAAVACAVQNIYLSVTAYGQASYKSPLYSSHSLANFCQSRLSPLKEGLGFCPSIAFHNPWTPWTYPVGLECLHSRDRLNSTLRWRHWLTHSQQK